MDMSKLQDSEERPVRLEDVAKAAGVSKGTASNVFSRPQVVREEVREKVKAAAEKLGYTGPDPKGRLLRAGKVNAIGVVTSEPVSYFFDDPFARVMMAGISEVCDSRGAGISLVSAVNEKSFAWNVQTALVDGFILFCIEGGRQLVELTRERGLPFIALELGIEDKTVSAIGVDNFAGAQMAARHLAELGHQRFAVLAMPFADNSWGLASMEQVEEAVYSDSLNRIHGYFAALAEHGIDTNAIPIYETTNDETTVRAGLDYIFSLPERPTAILAMSDRAALIALDWCAENGIEVPDDVSVVGFDGIKEGAMSQPPLTTIAQPIHEIGRRAAMAILDPRPSIVRETLDLSLTVRGSTGPVSSS